MDKVMSRSYEKLITESVTWPARSAGKSMMASAIEQWKLENGQRLEFKSIGGTTVYYDETPAVTVTNITLPAGAGRVFDSDGVKPFVPISAGVSGGKESLLRDQIAELRRENERLRAENRRLNSEGW